MVNHPNRSRSKPHASRNPEPTEIRAAREAAGLTQTQAAALVHTELRAWQQWEAEKGTPSHRRMHAAFWELFRIKVERLAMLDKYIESGKIADSIKAKVEAAGKLSPKGGR